jgi:hypothetical protein
MSRPQTKSRKTRVYITVDVECAEERVIGGALQLARGYDLRIWGRMLNYQEQFGIPLIVSELNRAGLRGTFFVEPFGSSYFGEAGLMEVCGFLQESGQDVQLHAHPSQKCIDWYTSGRPGPADDMAAYGTSAQIALLREGLEILDRCGVPRASVRAFRAGNFGANNDTWRAMAAVGLRVSSDFNLCYLEKSCRILWPNPANGLFDTRIALATDGPHPAGTVWELPVTNFLDGPGQFRHLQVSAVSFPELRHTLLEAHRMGLPEVTILTHPFEYFWIDSVPEAIGRPNLVNIERLRQICAFLRDGADLFENDTLGALAERLRTGSEAAQERQAVPRGRPGLRFGRLAEQAYKHLASRLPL